MNLRPMAAALVASSICFASADAASTDNPKTRQVPYQPATRKLAPEEQTARSKAEYEAQLLGRKLAALGQPPASKSQGSSQQGNPRGLPGTLALNGSDSCTTPDPLAGLGTFFFDNSAATTGIEGQTEALCLAYATTGISNDVWFVWTAPSNGTATMTLCGGTGMDSKIAAYAGTACPSAGTALACNDDSCGLQSSISFLVSSGSSYVLQLGNYPGATGLFGTFTLGIVSGGPANDDCSAAIAISGAGPFTFDTTGATTSAQQSGACPIAGHDIWYAWTAPSSGVATISLCGSSYDTIVAVYTAAGCPGAGTSYCNDDTCGLQSQTLFPCSVGNTYALQIGGYAAGSGPGTFTLNVAAGAPNDNCSTPTPISGNGTFAFDNSAATTGTEGQTEALCLAYATTGIANDVWFAWTAPSSGTATFSLCGMTGMDSKIAAYAGSGCPTAGTALACNDDTCALQSEISFPVTGGSTYLLQLGNYPGAGGAVGSFTLDVPGGGGVSYLCDPGSVGVISCPCANPPSGSGRGCDNSSATGGASISGSGNSSLSTPTLVFTTAGERPTATSIVLQGSSSNPAGLVFGQGVRCATGVLKRLYVKTASGGSITAPNLGAGDPDIPTRSATLGDPISAGQNRWYMVYYRDPVVLGGCSAFFTFNGTNTAQVLWQP
jgi:hypothetical protein